MANTSSSSSQILWNAKYSCFMVDENYLVQFEYADLGILTNICRQPRVLANARSANIDQTISQQRFRCWLIQSIIYIHLLYHNYSHSVSHILSRLA